MPQIDLTIIVPIYNVEDYLEECLNSIKEQEFDFSYEVLLINDGTKDGSDVIAQNFARKFPDVFKYFEQDNQGLSAARNTGFRLAQGCYVLFLDSDDYLSQSGLADLAQLAMRTRADVVVGNFFNLLEGGELQKNKSLVVTDGMTGVEWLEHSLGPRKYMPAAWFKVYRREFLAQNELTFVPGLINEDQLFAIQVFCKARSVIASDVPFYCYRHRAGSISSQADMASAIKRVDSDLYTTNECMSLVSDLKSNKLKRMIIERCIKLLGGSLLTMKAAGATADDSLGEYCKRADELKLWCYIRVTRFSHFVDWITLRLGFSRYLLWRQWKW